MPDRNLVFVVDDDASMLKSVARLLRQFGYESLLFPSATAFAEHRDFHEAICVLLDINLGDISGIELRRRLKAAGNSVPVIYITGQCEPSGVRSCSSLWMRDFFPQAVLSARADRAAQERIRREDPSTVAYLGHRALVLRDNAPQDNYP